MVLKISMPEYYVNKRNIPRFPPDLDIDQKESVRQYFRNHAISALSQGAVWDGHIECLGWGLKTKFRQTSDASAEYTSIYVYKSARGKGHMSKYLQEHVHEVFCTAPSCDIENYFKQKGASFVVMKPCPLSEYTMIKQYYGDSVTDRTGIHMINHIDEGLFILEQIGASELAKRAYIIHPLVQGDTDLSAFWSSNGPEECDKRVFALALEYRNIANAHLSYHPRGLDTFRLSPLKDVNDMLIADKVQNRKDFELYHLSSHPRSSDLTSYFVEWLEKLGISEQRYAELKGQMIQRTGGLDAAISAQRPSEGPSTAEESQPGFNQVAGALLRNAVGVGRCTDAHQGGAGGGDEGAFMPAGQFATAGRGMWGVAAVSAVTGAVAGAALVHGLRWSAR